MHHQPNAQISHCELGGPGGREHYILLENLSKLAS